MIIHRVLSLSLSLFFLSLRILQIIIRNIRCCIEAACKPSPCGENTQCEVINEVPVCTCLPGYRGSPLAGCRHECDSDSECPQHLACSSSYRCESPCKCGVSAECQVINHQAKCSCPKVRYLRFNHRELGFSGFFFLIEGCKSDVSVWDDGDETKWHMKLICFLFQTWLGNPLIACRPECTSHSECPTHKSACLYQKCVNPCDGVCGVNADCNLRGITPVCSCPKHMTGNPFVSCRLFEPRKLISQNRILLGSLASPWRN